jgi:hypothetical protein
MLYISLELSVKRRSVVALRASNRLPDNRGSIRFERFELFERIELYSQAPELRKNSVMMRAQVSGASM